MSTMVQTRPECAQSAPKENISRIFSGLELSNCTEQTLKQSIKFLSPFYNDLRIQNISPSDQNKKFYNIARPDFLVLEKLASHVTYKKIVNTDETKVFPGVKEIMKIGYSEKSVRTAIKNLVEKGLILRISPENENKKNSSNRYFFTKKIESLAELTANLENKKEISKDLLEKINKAPSLQKTLFEEAGLKASELQRLKRLKAELFKGLEQEQLSLERFIEENKRLTILEEKLKSKKLKSQDFQVITKESDEILNRNCTPRVQNLHHQGVKTASEILSSKYSYEILNNLLTTTKTKSDEKIITPEVSSSLLNYFSSLGFSFSKKHIRNKLPEYLEEACEESLMERVKELKKHLEGLGLWTLFCQTTFSISRLFVDSNVLVFALRKIQKELYSRINQGTLLEYKNFKSLFKSEQEAIQALFPEMAKEQELSDVTKRQGLWLEDVDFYASE